ncbi:MAG: NAD(P)/FAD-dependent oxidoreductase, partial [Akkermansiaceae bacterium]|nr:NAD(P)/FAD-dependent oxidoreductase [Akkermansiaceae bacterium]
MSNLPQWDLVVIGGGAAGFFAAITCAESAPGAKVLIVEKTAHTLSKVKISGGGRCNVTHACDEPKTLAGHYPRGSKALIGPFNRWSAADTVSWFSSRGVELKTEVDGRMFPTSDNSQTIIDCLQHAARQAGVIVKTSTSAISVIANHSNHDEETHDFTFTTNHGETHQSKSVLLATGGTRLAPGARLCESLGHTLIPNVPSLFAFNIDDERIDGLAGVSVANASVSAAEIKLNALGPLLITHHGLSGPGILKLSAWGARQLHELDYQFILTINWVPDLNITEIFQQTRNQHGKRKVSSRAPFEGFPKRLWKRLCIASGIAEDCSWSQLSKDSNNRLIQELTKGSFNVSGKSINKDEFVTCGGVKLTDINMKTLESKITPGLHFAGEVLDIDGITGGFNFQNAWT